WNPMTREFGKGEGRKEEAVGSRQEAGVRAVSSSETASAEAGSGGAANPAPYGKTGFNLAHAAESKLGSETATEWLFIIVSLLAAGIGIGLGLLFYVRDTRLPDLWTSRLRPLYEASYNKYWVDEFYGWAI